MNMSTDVKFILGIRKVTKLENAWTQKGRACHTTNKLVAYWINI
jgi:hypothetical protein